jgi:carnitine O-acetyltransferase
MADGSLMETSKNNVNQYTQSMLQNGSHHSMKPPLSATSLPQLESTPSAKGGITYAQQEALPRLPIPDLTRTLERFQARLAALQTAAQRQETARVVQAFLHGDGPRLHQALTEYEAEGRATGVLGSYVEEFWNESYLAPDASVVLNLNPFFVLEGGPDPKIATDQLRRAASLCFASIQLASVLKREQLTPDVFRGAPLCMHQFKALFGSSRQPTLNEMDDVHVFNDSTHGTWCCSRHQSHNFETITL